MVCLPLLEPEYNNKVRLQHYNNNSNTKYATKEGGDNDYKSLTQSVSQQVFHINGNITSIERLVGFLGTSRDTPDVRNKL